MAIEREIGAGGLPQSPLGMEQVDIIEQMPLNGSVELSDGSMLVGDATDILRAEETVEVPFDANLAEYIDESDLSVVASDIVSDIEDDLSSRQEWEDTYKSGVELLGMSYEERSQPFEGAELPNHL